MCVYDQVWDDELEKSATYWAEQCQWEHGPQDLLKSIGQNLAVHWGRYEYTHIYKDRISLFFYHNRLCKVLLMATVMENMDILEYLNIKIVISALKKSLEIEIVHSDLGTYYIFNILPKLLLHTPRSCAPGIRPRLPLV